MVNATDLEMFFRQILRSYFLGNRVINRGMRGGVGVNGECTFVNFMFTSSGQLLFPPSLRLFRGLRQSGVVPKTGNCRDGSIDCECLDAVCFEISMFCISWIFSWWRMCTVCTVSFIFYSVS